MKYLAIIGLLASTSAFAQNNADLASIVKDCQNHQLVKVPAGTPAQYDADHQDCIELIARFNALQKRQLKSSEDLAAKRKAVIQQLPPADK